MNKSRLVYIAILGVALLVLFWDKFINPNAITEPQASQAQGSQGDIAEQQDGLSQWTYSPFVQRVLIQQKAIGQTQHKRPDRNLFSPSHVFREEMSHPVDQQEILLDMDLHLTSISKGSHKDHVLINGQIIKIGETIGRYRLIEINREKIMLHVGTRHITLPIGDLSSFDIQDNVEISECNRSNCFSN